MGAAKFQNELLDDVAVFLLQTPAVFKRRLKLRDFENALSLDTFSFAQGEEVVKRDGALIKADGEMLSPGAHHAYESDLIPLRVAYPEDVVFHHPLPWRQVLHSPGDRIEPSPFVDCRCLFRHESSVFLVRRPIRFATSLRELGVDPDKLRTRTIFHFLRESGRKKITSLAWNLLDQALPRSAPRT